MLSEIEQAAMAISQLKMEDSANRRAVLKALLGSGLALSLASIPHEAHAQSALQVSKIPWSSKRWWPIFEQTARKYNIPRLHDIEIEGKPGPLFLYDLAYERKHGQRSFARDWQENFAQEMIDDPEINSDPGWVDSAGYCYALAYAGIVESHPQAAPDEVAIIDGEPQPDLPVSEASKEALLVDDYAKALSIPLNSLEEIIEELLNDRAFFFASPSRWYRAGFRILGNEVTGTNFGANPQTFEFKNIVGAWAVDRGDGSQKFNPGLVRLLNKIKNPEITDQELRYQLILPQV